MMAVAFL